MLAITECKEGFGFVWGSEDGVVWLCRDDQAVAGERGRGAAAAPARAPRLDPPPGWLY